MLLCAWSVFGGTLYDLSVHAQVFSNDLFRSCFIKPLTFVKELMHSIVTVVDVKILSYKSLKDTH